jgi:hypothetical protein
MNRDTTSRIETARTNCNPRIVLTNDLVPRMRDWALQPKARQFGAQSVHIHTSGLAYGREIGIVLEEIFFGLALETERTVNPFLDGADNDCLPKTRLGDGCLRLVRLRGSPIHC